MLGVVGSVVVLLTLSVLLSPGTPAPVATVQGGVGQGVVRATPQLVAWPPGPAPSSAGNVSLTSASWPGFQGASNLSGEALSGPPPSNGTLWRVYTGSEALPPSGPPAPSSPVVANGLVFEGTGPGGGVVALNATTGGLVWTTTLPGKVPVYGGMLEANDELFVPGWSSPTNGSGELYALNASTGSLLWSTSLGVRGPLVAPPNLVDGILLEADASVGYSYGWSLSGKLLYSDPLLGPTLEEPVSQPVSVLSPASPLALALAGPYVVAYNATNGDAYPGVAWSPLPLAAPSNGSVSQTFYAWEKGSPPGRSTSVPVAIVGENAGAHAPSTVEVLAPLGIPGVTTDISPVVASWTTPIGGEGFVGAPAVLGERNGNLTFALEQTNGSLAFFHFFLNATGTAALSPEGFVAWTSDAVAPTPAGSPVATGGPDGEVLLGTPDGDVEAISLATRSMLWQVNTTAPILSSPALANAQLFIANEHGVVRAIGGASEPPVTPKLLLSVESPPWVEALDRANLTVSGRLWYPNGTYRAASGAKVLLQVHPGNLTGSPANLSLEGSANATYIAPSVSRDVNATLYVNATWGSLVNDTSLSFVVVPPRLVNNTPLTVLADPVPPASLRSGQSVAISFSAHVGAGGPPLSGGLATFTAFGGTASVVSSYTNSQGTVNTTFTAGSPTQTPGTAGLTLTLEKAGYEMGTYSWVTLVNPQPSLVLQFAPASLLVVANHSATVEVLVNSTLGHPVENAVVSLVAPISGGNLSAPGGLTDATGELQIAYTAPSRVAAPGFASFIQVTATASGFSTVSASLPLTVVPNATSVASQNSTGSSGNPLAGLAPWAGWGLIVLLAVLVLAMLLLLLGRRASPPRSKSSVWEEWEGAQSKGPAGERNEGEGDLSAPSSSTESTVEPTERPVEGAREKAPGVDDEAAGRTPRS